MLTPPADLTEADLASALESGWGIRTGSLAYAPVGSGHHHWTTTDRVGRRWFLTADRIGEHGMNPGVLSAALATTLQLSRHGLEFVVPPLTARSGDVLHQVCGYAVSVFPLLDELAVASEPDVVDLIARLHTATPAVRAHPPIDALLIDDRTAVTDALSEPEPPPDGPYATRFRDLLRTHRKVIMAAFDQYDDGARVLSSDRRDWVITHGGPRPDNVMITPDGPVLIDWETLRLAPPARDVAMTGDADRYARLTGRSVDPDDLELFQLRWDLADLAGFATGFAEAHDQTPDTESSWQACVDICEHRLESHLNRA
ncbi:MAG: aminoglycoside phosphotransferase family protein [Microlunatus sp.]|nr:aminoglycoside phosphotransferase family protein [Microlunatus sp.]